MLNFFGSLFHKTIISFTGLAVLLGLVSATPQVTPTTLPSSTPQIAVQQASSTASSEAIATPAPLIKKISTAPSVSSVATPPSQPQTVVVQQPPVVTVPPLTVVCNNKIFCNNACYSACPTGQILACPATGNAYCQVNPNYIAPYTPPNVVAPAPSTNNVAVNNSVQDIEELQTEYAQDLGRIGNTPGLGLSAAQSEENALSELYNAILPAAQAGAPCFSPDLLTLAGGEQGNEALLKARLCSISAE